MLYDCGRGRRPARLRSAQQAMFDEDAGQLIADRLMDQRGGDRRPTPPKRPRIACQRRRALLRTVVVGLVVLRNFTYACVCHLPSLPDTLQVSGHDDIRLRFMGLHRNVVVYLIEHCADRLIFSSTIALSVTTPSTSSWSRFSLWTLPNRSHPVSAASTETCGRPLSICFASLVEKMTFRCVSGVGRVRAQVKLTSGRSTVQSSWQPPRTGSH